MNFAKKALEVHKKLKGKIEIRAKIPLKTKEDLSIAYTPGVGEVVLAISRELDSVWEYTMKQNTIAIVTDGSAILGLGDRGAEAALPVMEGKALLFKELADLNAIPVCLDTQDEREIVKIVTSIAPTFGGINLEDISAPRCFYIEEALQDIGIPVFHDDQWGSAIVILAGLENSLRLVGKKMEDVKIVFSGAGAAGIATTKLLLETGASDVTLVDKKGAIYKGRDDLNEAKIFMAEVTNLEGVKGPLSKAIKGSDVFIGVSAAGILTPQMVKTMAAGPIIFALANPVPEIMPEEAKKAGAKVVATGRSDFENQVNNSLVFPGIFKGALAVRAPRITIEMKLAAAKSLSGMIDPEPNQILPNALDREVPRVIAKAVAEASLTKS